MIVFNFLIINLYPFYSSFQKYLKKYSTKDLKNVIEAQHIELDGQYCFRSNQSTSLALTEFVEKVTSAMDQSQSTICVFIDLKKVIVILVNCNAME